MKIRFCRTSATSPLHEHRLVGFATNDQLRQAIQEFETRSAPPINHVEDAARYDTERKRQAEDHMTHAFDGTYGRIRSFVAPDAHYRNVLDQLARQRMDNANRDLMNAQNVTVRRLEDAYGRQWLRRDIVRERSLLLNEMRATLDTRMEQLEQRIDRYNNAGRITAEMERQLGQERREIDQLRSRLDRIAAQTEARLTRDEERDTRGLDEGRGQDAMLRMRVMELIDMRNPDSTALLQQLDNAIARSTLNDTAAMDTFFRNLQTQQHGNLRAQDMQNLRRLANDLTNSSAAMRYNRNLMRLRLEANNGNVGQRLRFLRETAPIGQLVSVRNRTYVLMGKNAETGAVILRLSTGGNATVALDTQGQNGTFGFVANVARSGGRNQEQTGTITAPNVRNPDGTLQNGFRNPQMIYLDQQ